MLLGWRSWKLSITSLFQLILPVSNSSALSWGPTLKMTQNLTISLVWYDCHHSTQAIAMPGLHYKNSPLFSLLWPLYTYTWKSSFVFSPLLISHISKPCLSSAPTSAGFMPFLTGTRCISFSGSVCLLLIQSVAWTVWSILNSQCLKQCLMPRGSISTCWANEEYVT